VRHTGVVTVNDASECAIRPLTRERALCIVQGQRQSDWCVDYPTEGDFVIASLIAQTNEPIDVPWCAYEVVWQGAVVGGVGAKSPPRDTTVEIGYGIAPSARGRGIATRAVALLVSELRAHSPALVIEAEIEAGNQPSIAVVTRLNFTSVGERDGLLLFRLHNDVHGRSRD